MRILITNDDGISSPALPILARWASKFGDVTVIAPKVEQSAKSQGIDIRNEIEVKRVDIGEDIVAYSVSSTPADCTRFGVLGLGEQYDLIISGINRGYNLGHDIAYSGTVAAIMEGSRFGINGLALSTDFETLIPASAYLDEVYRFITDNDLYNYNNLYNVNIPPVSSGIAITRQGGMFFKDAFAHRGGDMYIQTGEPITEHNGDLSIDIDAIRSGYISVTPLTAEKTNIPVFEKLKKSTQH